MACPTKEEVITETEKLFYAEFINNDGESVLFRKETTSKTIKRKKTIHIFLLRPRTFRTKLERRDFSFAFRFYIDF